MDRTNLRRPGTLVLATIAVGSVVALALGAAFSLSPTHAAAPPPAVPALAPTERPSRAFSPTATAVPLPKANTFGRPGAPAVPVDLIVPFVGGSWPVGLFVIEAREGPSKTPGAKSVTAELGLLNEADRPLTIGTAVQYREAISLYSEGYWKGLVFAGFHTASGHDVAPAEGSGAADLPPGVWGQVSITADVPEDDSVTDLRAGLSRTQMSAFPLAGATLRPSGQPWAAPGAAATPVSITAAPANTK